MLQFLNYQMRITINDARMIIGRFMAFDKHMNLILSDAVEYRLVGQKGKEKTPREEKRDLGLVLIRGECVVSLSVEGPPLEDSKSRAQSTAAGGPGIGRAIGRGVVVPVGQRPAGLAGPVRGVGGPAPDMMMPRPPVGQIPPQFARGAPDGGRGLPPMMGRAMPMGMPGLPPGLPPGALPPGMPPMPPGAMPVGRGMPPMMGRGMPPGMPGMPPGMLPPMSGPPGVAPPGAGQFSPFGHMPMGRGGPPIGRGGP